MPQTSTMAHNIDVRGNRRVGILKHSKAKWRIKYKEWDRGKTKRSKR